MGTRLKALATAAPLGLGAGVEETGVLDDWPTAVDAACVPVHLAMSRQHGLHDAYAGNLSCTPTCWCVFVSVSAIGINKLGQQGAGPLSADVPR